MSSSPGRRHAVVAAALVAFALVGGPVAAQPAGRGTPARVVAVRQAAPVALLAPTPTPTPGVPAAGRSFAERPASAVSAAQARAAAAEAERRALAARPVGRVVALTFDDGPDRRWTPQVLALLARYRAHATFCLIGRQVRTREALVRAVLAQGHTLCNHSFSHDERLATRAQPRIVQELRMTDTAIRRAAPGATVTWFRAPGGTWSAALGGPLALTGHQPLDWTVDPRDWDRPGAPAIVARVLAGLRPGAVVDLHDGGGDRSQTVAALRVLLPALAARGYTCVAITPALAARTL